MNRIHRIWRLAGLLAGLAGVLLASGPAALAVVLPPPGDGPVVTSRPAATAAVVTGGMPGWQITLIAASAALLAAAVAVLADRAWTARRKTITTAA